MSTKPQTLKLQRINLDALKNLNKDPTAVNRAMDAYQGAPRADRSVGNNLRDTAQALDGLRNMLEVTVPKAITQLGDIADQEAFDEWQTMDSKQREAYKTEVASGKIAAWQSPFFKASMEKMSAADSAMKYNSQFNEAWQNERFMEHKDAQGNSIPFDFDAWRIDYTKKWAADNGVNNLNPRAYTVFAKGISGVHNQAIQQRATAKGEDALRQNRAQIAAGVGLVIEGNGINDQGIPPGVHMAQQIQDFFQEHVIGIGLPRGPYLKLFQEVFKEKSIQAAIDGGRDGAFIAAAGKMYTGGKTKGGKRLTWDSTPAFKKWKRETMNEGDRLAQAQETYRVAQEKIANKEKRDAQHKTSQEWIKANKVDGTVRAHIAAAKRFYQDTPEGEAMVKEAFSLRFASGEEGIWARGVMNEYSGKQSPGMVAFWQAKAAKEGGSLEEMADQLAEDGLTNQEIKSAIEAQKSIVAITTSTTLLKKSFLNPDAVEATDRRNNRHSAIHIPLYKRQEFYEEKESELYKTLFNIENGPGSSEEKGQLQRDAASQFTKEVNQWKDASLESINTAELAFAKELDKKDIAEKWVTERGNRRKQLDLLKPDNAFRQAENLIKDYAALGAGPGLDHPWSAGQRKAITDLFKKSKQWIFAAELGIKWNVLQGAIFNNLNITSAKTTSAYDGVVTDYVK